MHSELTLIDFSNLKLVVGLQLIQHLLESVIALTDQLQRQQLLITGLTRQGGAQLALEQLLIP